MQNVAIRVEKQQTYEGLGYRWAESANLGIFCCTSWDIRKSRVVTLVWRRVFVSGKLSVKVEIR